MDTNDSPLRLHRRDDGIAILTLDRGRQKNLVDELLARALLDCTQALQDDRDVRCVILRAEGAMFSAGGDIRDMQAHCEDLPGHIGRLIRPVHEAIAALYALPMPLVGCVQGTAAGGGVSLALACDVVVAARSARFVFAYSRLGTTPDCGLTHALAERLGPAASLQLLLTRDALTAAEAHGLGLVQDVAEDGEALARAEAAAAQICSLPPHAARGLKRLFKGDARARLQSRLDAERDSFVACAATPEFRARVADFGSHHG